MMPVKHIWLNLNLFWIPKCFRCMHWCFVLLKLLAAIQIKVVMIWRVIMYCFVFFCYRAAWWIQGRPRTRLWCQRRQEPRSNLLKTHTVHIAHWTASHQDLKIFSAPRWTICHLIFLFFFFFFFFTCLGAFFHFPNWHITICFVFWRGPGFGFLSSEYHSRHSDFLTFTPSVPLGQAVVLVNLYGFFFFFFN